MLTPNLLELRNYLIGGVQVFAMPGRIHLVVGKARWFPQDQQRVCDQEVLILPHDTELIAAAQHHRLVIRIHRDD